MRRIGQTASSIHSMWIAGFSIDDSLDSMLQKKDKNCETVISGKPLGIRRHKNIGSRYIINISSSIIIFLGDPHQSPVEWFEKSSQRGAHSGSKVPCATSTLDKYFKPAAINRHSHSAVNTIKPASGKVSGSGATATQSFVWTSTDREEVESDTRQVSARDKDGSFLDCEGGPSSVMKNLVKDLVK